MKNVMIILISVLVGWCVEAKDHYVSPHGTGDKSGKDCANTLDSSFLSRTHFNREGVDTIYLLPGKYEVNDLSLHNHNMCRYGNKGNVFVSISAYLNASATEKVYISNIRFRQHKPCSKIIFEKVDVSFCEFRYFSIPILFKNATIAYSWFLKNKIDLYNEDLSDHSFHCLDARALFDMTGCRLHHNVFASNVLVFMNTTPHQTLSSLISVNDSIQIDNVLFYKNQFKGNQFQYFYPFSETTDKISFLFFLENQIKTHVEYRNHFYHIPYVYFADIILKISLQTPRNSRKFKFQF